MNLELLKPICKNLNLPLQPPVSVDFLKKVILREKLTGRIIEYKPSKSNSVVYITQPMHIAQLTFGQVESLFIQKQYVCNCSDV